MRTQVRSLASLSGLRTRHCRELWCGLQMQLRSRVAVAVVSARSCISDLTLSVGTSICCKWGPKKKAKKKKREREKDKNSCSVKDNCLTDFEKLMVSKGDQLGGGGMGWEFRMEAIKLGCDDPRTTRNVIKFIEEKKLL